MKLNCCWPHCKLAARVNWLLTYSLQLPPMKPLERTGRLCQFAIGRRRWTGGELDWHFHWPNSQLELLSLLLLQVVKNLSLNVIKYTNCKSSSRSSCCCNSIKTNANWKFFFLFLFIYCPSCTWTTVLNLNALKHQMECPCSAAAQTYVQSKWNREKASINRERKSHCTGLEKTMPQ